MNIRVSKCEGELSEGREMALGCQPLWGIAAKSCEDIGHVFSSVLQLTTSGSTPSAPQSHLKNLLNLIHLIHLIHLTHLTT